MSSSQTILITGCSSGFGLLAAKELARSGHTVYATMRAVDGKNADRATELRSVADDEGLSLHVLELDVTSDASVEQAVAAVIEAEGAIDTVVNNAGVMPVGVTEAFTVEQLQANLDVNLVGPFRVVRTVAPHMRAAGSGLIVQVSTIAGRMAVPFFGVYHASKWGLEGMSEALRYELSGKGIDVVVIEPGPFTTNLFPEAPSPADEERLLGYEVENQTLVEMGQAFEALFEDSDVPTDPQILVDTMVRVIETPAGERPFRTTGGVDFGVAEWNAAADDFRISILQGFGLEHMEGVRTQ